MVIKYNYIDDLVTVDGVDYQLSAFRSWLLSNHEQLCSGHFIKAINVGDRVRFTYDWQSIYLKAEEYQFINDFIYETTTR